MMTERGSKEFSLLLPLNLDEATERIADGREITKWNERSPNLGAARCFLTKLGSGMQFLLTTRDNWIIAAW